MCFSSRNFSRALLAQHIKSNITLQHINLWPVAVPSKPLPFQGPTLLPTSFFSALTIFCFPGSFFALHLKQLLPTHNSDSPASCGLVAPLQLEAVRNFIGLFVSSSSSSKLFEAFGSRLPSSSPANIDLIVSNLSTWKFSSWSKLPWTFAIPANPCKVP